MLTVCKHGVGTNTGSGVAEDRGHHVFTPEGRTGGGGGHFELKQFAWMCVTKPE